jgi:hypothetical protein
MFIPDPSRLFPPRMPSNGSSSLSGDEICLVILIIGVGGVGIAAIYFGTERNGWLGILAVLLCIGAYKVFSKRTLILFGVIDTIFYAGMMFILTNGREGTTPILSWIGAGVVAALFLWVTYRARRA